MRTLQLSILPLLYLFNSCDSGAIQLDPNNIDGIIQNNDLVLVNFYADWCRFSQMLAPIWDQTADKVAQEFPDKRVVVGKVDCDKESSLGGRYHITKYPTLKYIQNGVLAKKEYRGQRSVESFVQFVRDRVKDPIQELEHPGTIRDLDAKLRHVIGYFQSNEGPEYENYKKLAITLKEDCSFHAGVGQQFIHHLNDGSAPRLNFLPSKNRDSEGDQPYQGSVGDYETLHTWAVEKCSPLVREITFENAEELTEEGLPFLILFHRPDDHDSVKEYSDLVSRELLTEKTQVNFLTADGMKFAHPLHHLGKSKDDLPLLAIDSFRHMYLFPKYEQMRVPGKVKTFLQDLYSGKLHREFHYGPDPEEQKKEAEKKGEEEKKQAEEAKNEADNNIKDENKNDEGEVKENTDDAKHIPRTDEDTKESTTEKQKTKKTDPPESQFVHLGPSKNRYTILRDEF